MRRFTAALAMAAIATTWPALAAAGDQETAQQIAHALRASGKLVDYSIGVKFENGVAWLSGRVASDEQMAQAVALAEQMPSVREVVNKLDVKPTKSPAVRFQPQEPAAEADEDDVELTGHRASPVRSAARGGTDPGDPLVLAPLGELKPAPSRRGQSAVALTTGQEAAPQAKGAPRPMTPVRMASHANAAANAPLTTPASYGGAATPAAYAGGAFDQPHMPNYAWPSYAAYPNYAQVNYPKQYSPTCWPYIGPFYPYPQVPLGWRKVTLEWDDGWWFLDFDDRRKHKRRLGGL